MYNKTPNKLIFSGLVHCVTYFNLKTHFCPWSLNPACAHKCALKYFRLNLKMRSKFFEIPGRAVEVPVRHCARCRTGQVSAAARDTDWHRLSSPPAPRPNWNLCSTFQYGGNNFFSGVKPILLPYNSYWRAIKCWVISFGCQWGGSPSSHLRQVVLNK